MRPIVIIDDDAAVRDSAAILLGIRFADVRVFPSAEAFLAALNDIPDACLIIDVNLPGLSGFELLEALASRNRRMPSILLTGRNDELVQRRGKSHGAAVTLEKPALPDQLIAAIDQAFASER